MQNATVQKFPRTPHLRWNESSISSDDKILSSAETKAFLQKPLVVEEKVDGANLGFSVGPDGRLRAQSRANFLNPSRCHAQWRSLWPWLARKEAALTEALGSDLILYGEWCYAQHTFPYDRLPDWFLGFDVREVQTGFFWSSVRRNALLANLGLHPVPGIRQGVISPKDIPRLLKKSRLRAGPPEGIYLRIENETHLLKRAKIVGDSFQERVTKNWSRRVMTPNQLADEADAKNFLRPV